MRSTAAAVDVHGSARSDSQGRPLTAPGGNQRVARHLVDRAAVLVAWPEQQFGPSTVTALDAHLQYHWRVAGRLRPFAGGGLGVLFTRSDFVSDNEFTLSAAGGARIAATDRISVLGEFRLRGIDADFTGTTAELLGGVTIRVGGR